MKTRVTMYLIACAVFLFLGIAEAGMEGNVNTFYGTGAGNSTIDDNEYGTFIGANAGYSNIDGIGNVFLGYSAGYFETGSNKLYIDNSDTMFPLIYGEFDTGIVGINGWLGIGTSSPQGKLHTEDIVYDVGAGTCPNGRYIKGDFDGEADADDCKATGIVALENGDVGIGTENPNYKLHIHSNKPFGYLQLTTKNTGTASDDGFFWGIEGNEAYFWSDTDMPIYFYAGGGSLTVFRENGRVGIGVSNPSYRLDVNGIANASQLCIAGDCRSNWPGGGSGLWSLNSTDIYYNLGNVGIGTFSPGYELDVTGTINASTAMKVNGTDVLTSYTETDPTVPSSIKDGIEWTEVSNRPSGLDDGDDVGITIEVDPRIGSLASGKWCTSDGTQVNCTSNLPGGSGTNERITGNTNGEYIDFNDNGDGTITFSNDTDNSDIMFDFSGLSPVISSPSDTTLMFEEDVFIGYQLGTNARTALPDIGTDPAIWVYSNDTTQTNDWIKMYHDQSRGIIEAAGTLQLKSFYSKYELKNTNSNELMFGMAGHPTWDQFAFYVTTGGSGGSGNQLILTTVGNGDLDHDHAAPVDPTFFVHSSTNVDLNNSQWISIAHDKTDGVIDVGSGNIVLNDPVTIKDVVRLTPRATAPGSPSAGDIYFDSTNNDLCVYDGSAWDDLTTGTSPGNCS